MDDLDRPATTGEAASLRGPPGTGALVALMLYGVYVVLFVQHLSGPLWHRIDRRVKATLLLVFCLITGYTGMLFADAMFWQVSNDRSFYRLLEGTTLEALLPVVAAITGAPVQLLLMLRTAVLLRSRTIRRAFVSFTILVIAAGVTGACMATTAILLYFYGSIAQIDPLTANKAYAWWLWCSAAVDVAVSVALALTLKQRVAGFSERTDSLLYKLIQSGLQTAAYTSILAVAGAAVAVSSSDFNVRRTYISYAFWSPLPACYGLSLYTTLGTRRTVDEYIGTSVPLPGSTQHNLGAVTSRPGGGPRRVELPREMETRRDRERETRIRMDEDEEEEGRGDGAGTTPTSGTTALSEGGKEEKEQRLPQ
ncbi:hypothetical protein JCM8097_000378 [Rhodosporidiobolus ruineniae]